MFCPPNDTLQTISVKTKLLAQKCTQQIRLPNQCINLQKKDVAQASLIQNENPDGSIVSGTASDKPTFQCFCPCKQTQETHKTLPKKNSNKDITTKWYVKVITLIFFCCIQIPYRKVWYFYDCNLNFRLKYYLNFS